MAGSPTVSVLAMARSRLTPAAQAAQAAHSAAQSAVRAIYPEFETAVAGTVVLRIDDKRYVFGGMGESVQRLAGEYHARLPRMQHMFLSRCRWDHLAGLPGVLLTMADSVPAGGKASTTVYAPPNIAAWIASTSYFIARKNMHVNLVEVSPQPHQPRGSLVEVFKDKNITVRAVVITSRADQPIERTTEELEAKRQADQIVASMFDANATEGVTRKRGRNAEKDTEDDSNEVPKNLVDDSALVYIVELVAPLGKLLVDQAKALGVPPGPMFKQLKEGSPVTLADGRTVHPHQCLEEGRPGEHLIVVTCPTLAFIDQLVSSPAFASIQGNRTGAVLLYHMGPPSVLVDERYRQWVHAFGPTTQHVVIDAAANQLWGKTPTDQDSRDVFAHAACTHATIGHLQPDLALPLSVNWAALGVASTLASHPFPFAAWPELVLAGSQTNSVILRLGRSLQAKFPDNKLLVVPTHAVLPTAEESRSTAISVLQAREGFAGETAAYYERCRTAELDEGNWCVTPLGTGSACPSTLRNVTSIWVQLNGPDHPSFLFDCGEGTTLQLLRLMSNDYAQQAKQFAGIKCVFVSHHHADHHMGTISFLFERATYTNEPLYVVGPPSVERYLFDYTTTIEPLPPYVFLTNQALQKRPDPGLLAAIGASALRCVTVYHCQGAFGYVVDRAAAPPFRVVYSGDTKPCTPLIHEGSDCDLLIHEATFEDGMEKEAALKRHSTIGQAIKVAHEMNARRCLLTHFSQRYPRAPELYTTDPSEDGSSSSAASLNTMWNHRTGLAFDLVQVTARTFPLLVHLKPLLPLVFPAVADEDEPVSEDAYNADSGEFFATSSSA